MAAYEVSDLLLDLLRLGITTVTSAGIFKVLGERWINSHFEKQLQHLKHEQQKELENVRLSIQLMHGRVSKIHEREFEVLPKAWRLLQEAYGWTARVTAFLKYHPDVKLLSDEKLDELLVSLKFTPAQIKELMASSKRQEDFVKAYDIMELDSARESHRILGNYLMENQIFMNEELTIKFLELRVILTNALNDHCSGRKDNDRDDTLRCYHAMESLGPSVKEIGQLIQKRLHYEDA